MTEEAHPEAAAILRDAGWTPHPEWNCYTRGTLVMGGFGGSFHVKDYARIPPGHPQYGADTPDTAEEAAAWLVARFAPNPLTSSATFETMSAHDLALELALQEEPEETPAHESDSETGEAPVLETSGDDGSGGAADAEGLLGAELSGFDEGGDGGGAIDADFDVADLGSEELDEPADLPLIEGDDAEEIEVQTDGPIAYGASTIDGLIREKLGRVSQIARELKATLQDGWTVEEYAYLQNLMVRMDRGEAPDDQAARERFLAIAAKSQAMSRIDAVRDRKEGELEDIGNRRDFDAAVYYEPSEGWPA